MLSNLYIGFMVLNDWGIIFYLSYLISVIKGESAFLGENRRGENVLVE